VSLRDFTVAAGLVAVAAAGFVTGRTGRDVKIPTGIVSVSTAEAAVPATASEIGTGGTNANPGPLKPPVRERLSALLEAEIESFAVHLESHIDRIRQKNPDMFVKWEDESGLANLDALAENARRFHAYVAKLPKNRPIDNLGAVANYCVTKSESLRVRAVAEGNALALAVREP
jgi:hypothetical protein